MNNKNKSNKTREELTESSNKQVFSHAKISPKELNEFWEKIGKHAHKEVVEKYNKEPI
jgi:hypothetical protein